MESQRTDSMDERHGAGMERSVNSSGNYYDGDDNRKPDLEVDCAYYRKRYCIRTGDYRRAIKELVVGELPWRMTEEPAIAAVVAAVAYVDETDADCKNCKS